MSRTSAPSSTCPGCAGPLVELRLGAELALRSCSTCDSRWWLRGDAPTDLAAVLDVVAETTPRRRAVLQAR